MSNLSGNEKIATESAEMVLLTSYISDGDEDLESVQPTESTGLMESEERDAETELSTADNIVLNFPGTFAINVEDEIPMDQPQTSASTSHSEIVEQAEPHSSTSADQVELERIAQPEGVGSAVGAASGLDEVDDTLPGYNSAISIIDEETSFATIPAVNPPSYQEVIDRNRHKNFTRTNIDPPPSPPPSPPPAERDMERDLPTSRLPTPKFSRTEVIISISVVAALLVFFIVFFPFQFSYVPYHQWGLVRSRSTGRVFTDRVYESGCYVLGVDREFIYLNRYVQVVQFDNLDMFTKDNVALAIKYNIYYKVTQQGAASLYKQYATNYHDIIVRVCASTIRNVGSRLDHHQYLTNRRAVTDIIQQGLIEKFDGWGINVSYTNLLHVYLPQTILNLKLQTILTKIETEKEYALRRSSLVGLETRRQIQIVSMLTAETLNNASYRAEATRLLAGVDKLNYLDLTTVKSLRAMSDKLSLDREELRLSYLYLTTLRSMKTYRGAIGYSELMNLVSQGIW